MLNKLSKKKMKLNKRGIEPVIATVLLIVITIVLVALVVSFVVPWLQTQIKTTDLCFNTKLEIKDLCYNEAVIVEGVPIPANVSIRIARGADSVDITKITFGISNATGTKTDERLNVPNQLEEIVYYIPVTGTPTSAKIAATVKSGTTEVACDYGQEKAIQKCA